MPVHFHHLDCMLLHLHHFVKAGKLLLSLGKQKYAENVKNTSHLDLTPNKMVMKMMVIVMVVMITVMAREMMKVMKLR